MLLPGLQAAPAVATAVLYSGNYSILGLLAMLLAACASMASSTAQLGLAASRVSVAAGAATASAAVATASGTSQVAAALAVMLAQALMQHVRVVYHSAVLVWPSTGDSYLVRTQSMSGQPGGGQVMPPEQVSR